MSILLLLGVLVVVSLATDEYVIKHGSELATTFKGKKAVIDIVHAHTQCLEDYYGLYNQILIGIFVILPLTLGWTRYNKKEFLIDVTYFMTILFIIRKLLTILSIHTPPSDTDRNYLDDWKHRVFGHFDCFPSGHLCFALGMVLMMSKHNIIDNKKLWLAMLAGYGYFSVASKAHYSIDIVGAFMLTPLVYDYYVNESASKKLLF